MPDPRHLALVHGWMERIDEVGLVDALDEIARSDLQFEHPSGTADIEETRRRFFDFATAFPDTEASIDEVISDGDRLVLVLEFTATHAGPLRNIPATGRRVRSNITFVIELDGERIARMRSYLELLGVMEQIGVLAPREE